MAARKTVAPAIFGRLPATMKQLVSDLNLSKSAINRNVRQLRQKRLVCIKCWDGRKPVYARGKRDAPRPPYDIKSQWKRSNDKRKSIRHAKPAEL